MGMVEVDEDIHVAVLALVATGVGAKEPGLGHGLRGQVVGDDLCHVSCTHGFSIKMTVQRYELFLTWQNFYFFCWWGSKKERMKISVI